MAIDDSIVIENGDKNSLKMSSAKPWQLFRYASKSDQFLMLSGLVLAVVEGAGIPLALYFFYSDIIDAMIVYSPCFDQIREFMQNSPGNGTSFEVLMKYREALISVGNGSSIAQNSIPPEITHFLTSDRFEQALEYDSFKNIGQTSLFSEVWPLCVYYALVGFGMFLAGSIHVAFWSIAGHRQVDRIKQQLFGAMLSKDAAWFDMKRTGALNALMFDNVKKIEDGITRISITFSMICMALIAYVIAFVINWKVTIVVFAFVPLIFISGFVMIRFVRVYSMKQSEAYASAGTIANEVLTNIRTVLAFNRQEYEVERYCANLIESSRMGTYMIVAGGAGQGIALLFLTAMAGMSFWWGNNPQVLESGGNILVIIICLMMGTQSLANAAPHFTSLSAAMGSAGTIFSVIEQQPAIDNFSESGEKPDNVTYDVTFENVSFAYPNRLDHDIFRGLDLKIAQGQTVALVGGSGSGKSTATQLLLRFYDTCSGSVRLGGKDIRSINVKWLRQQMAVVSQEPVLFNMSIGDNIRLGAMARQRNVSAEDLDRAVKMANAHEFISKLPSGYDTTVGERGAQLSGGQKQRIALARALISEPKILILDEATSALDTASERVVQDALDKARIGRTTLIIAHRLSTIRNADLIAVIEDGKVAELGNHNDLIKNTNGLYFRLVQKQQTETPNQPNESAVSGTKSSTEFETHFEVMDAGDGISTSNQNSNKHKSVSEYGYFKMIKVAFEWGRPELSISIFCALLSAFSGAIQPAESVVVSEFVASFCPGDNQDKFSTLIGIIVGLGVLQAIVMTVQHYLFALIGERLTQRIRRKLLAKFLQMDAAWLDRHENQPSHLETALASDCHDIQGLSGIRLSLLVRLIVILGTVIIYSLILEYRITLAFMAVMPIIVVSNYFYFRMVMGTGDVKTDKSYSIASDALSNMRTVMALTAERYFKQRFEEGNFAARSTATKRGILAGPLFALAMAGLLWGGAVTFTLGSWLVEKEDVPFSNIIRIYMMFIISGMFFGQAALPIIPTEDDAKKASKSLLTIFNEPVNIDKDESKNHASSSKAFAGRIEFQNVSFSYPTRPAIKILDNVSFVVEAGQRVAICGPSGGGKSTIMQLIQRLYDSESGKITIDGKDIKEIDVRNLRNQIGLVAQEPALFAKSIEENVAYGLADGTSETFRQACERANALEFIDRLPEGMKTQVGERGAQLSGGQKQRIAIARAIVRNPSLLLLDEATSALDANTEKIVQAALDNASNGRTTLAIAHRLSTIANSDRIIVLAGGRVAEQGRHEDLLAQRGLYHQMMHQLQTFGQKFDSDE